MGRLGEVRGGMKGRGYDKKALFTCINSQRMNKQ